MASESSESFNCEVDFIDDFEAIIDALDQEEELEKDFSQAVKYVSFDINYIIFFFMN